MVAPRRKSASSEQFQALTDTNTILQADKMQLVRDNSDLKAVNSLLEQKIKYLQVAITILLASNAGLTIGLATSMAGATAQTALASATGAFFAVITASIAILIYMRRLPRINRLARTSRPVLPLVTGRPAPGLSGRPSPLDDMNAIAEGSLPITGGQTGLAWPRRGTPATQGG
jgi:hypothetical protein